MHASSTSIQILVQEKLKEILHKLPIRIKALNGWKYELLLKPLEEGEKWGEGEGGGGWRREEEVGRTKKNGGGKEEREESRREGRRKEEEGGGKNREGGWERGGGGRRRNGRAKRDDYFEPNHIFMDFLEKSKTQYRSLFSEDSPIGHLNIILIPPSVNIPHPSSSNVPQPSTPSLSSFANLPSTPISNANQTFKTSNLNLSREFGERGGNALLSSIKMDDKSMKNFLFKNMSKAKSFKVKKKKKQEGFGSQNSLIIELKEAGIGDGIEDLMGLGNELRNKNRVQNLKEGI